MSKQEIERYYFDMFSKDYQLPPGNITYTDKPDFIIEGQRRVGIEMTNFYLEEGSLPASEQSQRKLRERIVSKAKSIYQAGGGKKIEITFGFDKKNPIRYQKKLIGELVKLAKHIESLASGIITTDIYSSIPELSFVYLYAEEHLNTRWRIVQVYNVPAISLARLINIVVSKEKKARQYKRCDAYWLLIIVDFIDPAQDQEILIRDFNKIRTKIFDKVIIYKTFVRSIVEIK
jgi:hypothetical protein